RAARSPFGCHGSARTQIALAASARCRATRSAWRAAKSAWRATGSAFARARAADIPRARSRGAAGAGDHAARTAAFAARPAGGAATDSACPAGTTAAAVAACPAQGLSARSAARAGVTTDAASATTSTRPTHTAATRPTVVRGCRRLSSLRGHRGERDEVHQPGEAAVRRAEVLGGPAAGARSGLAVHRAGGAHARGAEARVGRRQVDLGAKVVLGVDGVRVVVGLRGEAEAAANHEPAGAGQRRHHLAQLLGGHRLGPGVVVRPQLVLDGDVIVGVDGDARTAALAEA